MNNATVISLVGLLHAVLFAPWWAGFIIGLLVGLLSCLLVDGIWWFLRKLSM